MTGNNLESISKLKKDAILNLAINIIIVINKLINIFTKLIEKSASGLIFFTCTMD